MEIFLVPWDTAAKSVATNQFQCVGATAMLIASKYEEIHPPEISDFLYAVDYVYEPEEILAMETQLLVTLNYRISAPTGYNFLQRFLFVSNASRMMSYTASYYLESVLQVEEALSLRPSEIASAAVCLAIGHPGIRDPGYNAGEMVSTHDFSLTL
jgi:hypothetical protein